jgi:hypothetical protein
MGADFIKLTHDELLACKAAWDLIEKMTFELGMLKRGHQHLWNDIGVKYELTGKRMELDYETGLLMIKETELDG